MHQIQEKLSLMSTAKWDIFSRALSQLIKLPGLFNCNLVFPRRRLRKKVCEPRRL